jgi:hypothetical protein
VLSVHVRAKAPLIQVAASEAIPSMIDGVPTDVLHVGQPRLCFGVDSFDALEVRYQVTPAGPRRSAISALAPENGGMLALGSGHGLLPIVASGFERGVWDAGDDKRISISEPAAPSGLLIQGNIGRNLDYALVSFSTLEPASAVEGHHLARGRIPWARELPRNDALVQHVSPRRGGLVTGHVVGDGLVGGDVTLGHAPWSATHSSLIVVANEIAPFAKSADSGSLVFDNARRAVGFVVGASETNQVSYVLTDFAGLRSHMGVGLFRSFFEKDPS